MFQTQAEVERLRINSSRPMWKRRDFRVQSDDVATFQKSARSILHSRAESLGLEILNILSGKSEHESRRIRIQTQIA